MGTIDLEQRETTFVGATWRERRKGGPGTAIAGRERASEGRSTFLIFFFFSILARFFPHLLCLPRLRYGSTTRNADKTPTGRIQDLSPPAGAVILLYSSSGVGGPAGEETFTEPIFLFV
ncbi:hypothetical protein QG37_07272 [Candidozyma auris]|nr:hypothetical protein QG37_07272 [[Candida] auris]